MAVHRDDRRTWADERLLAAIAARDGTAFATFYRRHSPAVLAYLMRELRDREAVADLSAEVFAAVLIAAGRYRAQGSSATPWVIGIARNKLLMSLRHGRVEARARHRLGFAPVELRDDDLDRIELTAAHSAGRLAEIVDRLPEHERYAVHSHVVEERSYRDIAAELQCSEMVIRKRVSRGLEHVRRQLNES
jgi:RNA polymerase sigma-70 factor (ECF subfamily)